ncbi:MAG: leucyl aminopeptidase [Candidatus Rhabdochlamydia sp.]
MHFSHAPLIENRTDADCIILPCFQLEKGIEPLTPYFAKEIEALLESGDFLAKEGEVTTLYLDLEKEKRLVLLGCGKKEECSLESWRRAISSAVKLARQKKWKALNIYTPSEEGVASAITEGVFLTHYIFDALKCDTLKKEAKALLESVCLVGISEEVFKKCQRAFLITESVNFTRDLVNGNADDITPQKLASVARELAASYPVLETTVMGKEEMKKEGLGLILAVNRSSVRDPALITVKYQGNPNSNTYTALVGKGITYDTGGLNLKPRGSMETMKDDMSGAGSVLGTLKAVASLKLPVNIIGVIPSTENSIGSNSYKPGDVYKSYSGKTVEIADTDAEGRLVLADAISYLEAHYPVSHIIDLATLTGGVVVALGEHVTGLFSNNQALADALTTSGEKVYERVWRLPLYDEYKESLKSSIADIKNAGDRKASAINGALFIQEFVKKETPWAHLDIAGTAYLSTPHGYHTTPATGVGVRLLVEYFSQNGS